MVTKELGYEYDGEIYSTLKDLTDAMNANTPVRKKDVEEGGKYSDVVSLVELDSGEDVEEESKEDDWEEGYPQGMVRWVSRDDVTITPEEMEKDMPEFEDIKEFKDYFRELDDYTAEYMARALNLEWKPTDKPQIHRMRISMAIQRHLFPELFKPKETSSKKSKYGDYSTDELVTMAKENKVGWKETDNEPINRMRVIQALKKEGHLE